MRRTIVRKLVIKLLIILPAAFVFSLEANAKSWICYNLIHTQVDNTLDENKIQKKALNNQGLLGVQHGINKKSMGTLQEQFAKVRQRLNTVGLLIDAGFMALEVYPVLQNIEDTQADIFDIATDSPKLLTIAVESEAEVVDKALSVVRFIAGIILSAGDINQMKPGDRKILLQHAVNELKVIDSQSYVLLLTLRRVKREENWKNASYASWVNKDQGIIREIINQTKALL